MISILGAGLRPCLPLDVWSDMRCNVPLFHVVRRDHQFPRAGRSKRDNALDGIILATIGTGMFLNGVGAEIAIFVKQFA